MEKALIGFVIASKARQDVLKFLVKNRPSRPMEITRKLSYDQPYITRTLQALEKKKLVECLTPDKKGWRVYSVTKLGKKIVDKI